MKKKTPHIEITAKDFYNLVSHKIQDPGEIPDGDWMPPEIVLDGYIVNNNISIEDQLEFKNFNFEKVRICFLNCRLQGIVFRSLKLRSITFFHTDVDVVEVSESSLEIFKFDFSNSRVLNIKETTFRQHLSLRDGAIKNHIWIDKVSVSRIGITNIDSNFLRIQETTGSFSLCGGLYGRVRLYNNNFLTATISSLNNSQLSSSTNKSLQVITPLHIENDKSEYKYGKLELGPNFNNSVIIKGGSDSFLNIDEIEIKDSVFSDIKVIIDQIEVRSIKFIGLINTSLLSLFNIKFISKKSLFHIENSFLGTARLFNFDFKEKVKLIFKHSDIKETSFNHIDWPDNLCEENIEDKIELYRQLKHIASNNNDSINAVRFYSIEKNAFYEKLHWTFKDFGTKLIFLLNKKSNNNNLSWLKPIAWNLGIQFVLFILIGFVLSFNTGFNFINFKDFLNPITKFLFLLNPAFNVDSFDSNINKNGWAIFIVTFSKIITAYLIYQTVAAYRRYK